MLHGEGCDQLVCSVNSIHRVIVIVDEFRDQNLLDVAAPPYLLHVRPVGRRDPRFLSVGFDRYLLVVYRADERDDVVVHPSVHSSPPVVDSVMAIIEHERVDVFDLLRGPPNPCSCNAPMPSFLKACIVAGVVK